MFKYSLLADFFQESIPLKLIFCAFSYINSSVYQVPTFLQFVSLSFPSKLHFCLFPLLGNDSAVQPFLGLTLVLVLSHGFFTKIKSE